MATFRFQLVFDSTCHNPHQLAAKNMWAKALTVRLAPAGIPVEVRPGVIPTEMTAEVAAKYDARIADGLILAGRWGEGGDVAQYVVGLASGQSAYANGTVVNCDGGLMILRL